MTSSALSHCPVCGKIACIAGAGTGFIGYCSDPDCKLGANNLQADPADSAEIAGRNWNAMVSDLRKEMGLPEEELPQPVPRPRARKTKPAEEPPPPIPEEPEESVEDPEPADADDAAAADEEAGDVVEFVEAVRINGKTYHLEPGDGCDDCVFLHHVNGLAICVAHSTDLLHHATELCTANNGQWKE